MIKSAKFLGAILLTAGTAIGAGMLALPIATGVGGFFPATMTILLCFLYMLSSLFLLLEANLYLKEKNNIISMAQKLIGWPGTWIAWLSFTGLLYAVSAAYMSGGGALLSAISQKHISWSNHVFSVIFALFFGATAYFGIRWIDKINRFLMLGLMSSYLYLIFTMAPSLQSDNLHGGHPIYLWATIPVILLSFTSHIILPSLREYLDHDVIKLKKALWIGSLIPLVCYLIWESLILGLIPQEGANGIMLIAQAPHPLQALIETLQRNGLQALAIGNSSFSFFALVTSFLGVLLSLQDFLADGLSLNQSKHHRLLLLTITVIPPLALMLFYPSFIHLLSYAGVLVAILYIILPSVMVYRARYHHKMPAPAFVFPGGKISLALMFISGFAVVGIQIAATHQWLPSL